MSALDGMAVPSAEQNQPVSVDTPVQEGAASDAASPETVASPEVVTMTQEELNNLIAERERVFQSKFDKRFAEEQKKARQEIDALKSQMQPTLTPAQQSMAQTMAASGMTQDAINKAFEEGRGVQVLEEIAAKAAERVFQSQTSAMQQEQQAQARVEQFHATMRHLKEKLGMSDMEMDRAYETADRFVAENNYLPDPADVVIAMLGYTKEAYLESAIKARRSPPPAPTKPAPSLVGSPTGSAISEVKTEGSIYTSGGYRNLM